MEASTITSVEKQAHSTTTHRVLSAQQFYQHDPCLRFLKETLRLRNSWISIGMILPPAIVYLSWWIARGTTFPPGWEMADLIGVLLQIFVLFPLLFLMYALIPQAIAHLFNTLYSNGVIGPVRSKERARTMTYAGFQKKLISAIDNLWWTIAVVGVVVLYVVVRLVSREFPDPHNVLPFTMRAIVIIMYAPLMFATGMSVVRLVLALVFMNLLFDEFALQIKPLHGDGSGGLGILEQLLWLSIGMMLWVVLLIVAALLCKNLSGLSYEEVGLLAAIYVALIPALFIGWLIIPHRMMLRARTEALQPLIATYQHTLSRSLSSEPRDTQHIEEETHQLEVLKKHYDLAYASYPVWPLDMSTVSSASLTVIIPVIVPLIGPPLLALIGSLLQNIN